MSILQQAVVFMTNGLEQILAPNAKRIRALMKSWERSTILIGKELMLAKEKVLSQEGGAKMKGLGWKAWVKTELKLSPDHADKLIRAYQKFGARPGGTAGLSNAVLLILSNHSTPPTAITEVFERAERGERVSKRGARAIVKQHHPKPAKANEIARKTGKAVLASDGYLYLGATQKEVAEGNLRRTVVYDVRDAVHTLASIKITPREFLEFAFPHQLWKPKEAAEIAVALEWLQELNRVWISRNVEGTRNVQSPAIAH